MEKYTELEKVLQRTAEKQSRRIASLILELDLAHSQIEILKAKEKSEEKEV